MIDLKKRYEIESNWPMPKSMDTLSLINWYGHYIDWLEAKLICSEKAAGINESESAETYTWEESFLPCPFCGEYPVEQRDIGIVYCNTCGYEMDMAAWNRRA